MRKSTMWAGALVLSTSVVRTVAAQEQGPPHQTFTIQSAALHETRRINVYLPPQYDTDSATRFPVLYMPDGGVQEDFPHVSATVDSLIRAGRMRPMLLVGIENTERRRDATGQTEVAEDRQIAPRVGGSAAFRAFIASELMPQVYQRFRVTGEAAVIGESLMGLFIVETFFQQPELFDTYVALSPSLWWNADELVKKASERLTARPGLHATLYFASANEETIAPQAARLAEAFRAHAPAGVTWQYAPRPDLRHDNIYRSLEAPVLSQLFPPAR